MNEEVMPTPLLHETCLGELDNNAIDLDLTKSGKRKQKPQSTYSDENRYLIAKYVKTMVHQKLLSFSRISTK